MACGVGGMGDATINNCIKLPAGTSFEFKEHHDIQIDTDFDIIFTGNSPDDTGKSIVVIETYHKLI